MGVYSRSDYMGPADRAAMPVKHQDIVGLSRSKLNEPPDPREKAQRFDLHLLKMLPVL